MRKVATQDDALRALTLIQPMASAIVCATPRAKRIENRPRSLPRRMLGQSTVVAVHAGAAWSRAYADLVTRLIGDAIDWRGADLHRGCVVGLMRLSGRQFVPGQPPVGPSGEVDPWWSGPYGYEVSDAEACAEPIPCRGGFHRGWWRLPTDVVASVYAQLPRWEPGRAP